MGEQGGYSGPQLFERTVALVKKYRKTLDDGAQRPLDPASAPTQEPKSLDGGSSNQATAQSDQRHLQESNEAEPLIRLPERHDPFSKTSDPNTATFPPFTQPGQLPQMQPNTSSRPSLFSSPVSPALQAEAPKRKVIFASGGITNERQVQEVLAAGSSVALLYTALVYGGVGTVSSIKGGLEEEMKRAGLNHGLKQTK